jgi:polyphosphate kinase
VGPDDTVNVFLTNKMVKPGVNVVFGAFDYQTKESVMVVNCNPPQ